MFDLASIVKDRPSEAHLYCCGPVPMLEAFEAAAADRPDARACRIFQGQGKPGARGRLRGEAGAQQSHVAVEAGKTISSCSSRPALHANYACSEGVCGTCETRVLEGIPDHRDLF